MRNPTTIRKFFPGYILLSFLLNLGFSQKIEAQVTFAWPATAPDVARYPTVEACLTALQRIYRLDARVQKDDVALPINFLADTFSTQYTRTARDCSEKFTMDQLFARDSVHIGLVRNAYHLLLFAQRDSDARALGDRWLTSIASNKDTVRAFVLNELVSGALTARPILFDDAWARIEQQDIKKFWYNAIVTVNMFRLTAKRVLDTGNANKAARWLAKIPGIVDDSVTQTMAWQGAPGFSGAGRLIYDALQDLEVQKLMDSLRKSTDAYDAHLKALYAASKLNGKIELKPAQPLVADFWFPHQPATSVPQPGTVSVIVTTYDNDCATCLGGIAMIRRLHDRFPTVNFTLLAQTRGYHGLVIEPPTPDLEATLIDSVYRRTHGFPGSVAISQTKFWRIEGLDRRRIDEDTPNQETYPTRDKSANSARVYLIDKNSRIVVVRRWDRTNEEEIGRFLDALVHQP